jgi:hypothetical protein
LVPHVFFVEEPAHQYVLFEGIEVIEFIVFVVGVDNLDAIVNLAPN